MIRSTFIPSETSSLNVKILSKSVHFWKLYTNRQIEINTLFIYNFHIISVYITYLFIYCNIHYLYLFKKLDTKNSENVYNIGKNCRYRVGGS